MNSQMRNDEIRPANLERDQDQSKTVRLPYLDGWRGLAIFFVLIGHFYPVNHFYFGRLGVDIFFVLSGLLMSNILYVERISLVKFYKRRISRVFPAFFVYISFIYIMSNFFWFSGETSNYLYTLFFLRSYIPISPDIWNTGIPIGHIWSLNVEEHCYIVLSLITLIAFLRKREFTILFLLGGSSIALQYVYIKHPEIAPMSYRPRTEIVASHLLISAAYCLIKHNFEEYVRPSMPIVAFVVGCWCYSSWAPWYASWTISPLMLAFVVNHLSKMPSMIIGILSFGPMRQLGIWSFSIYLWQQPFYEYYSSSKIEFLPLFGGILLFSAISMGVISFYLIENPVRRWLNSKW
jgi:peptidoglycan/LPS O-acetylase OafA/YrhL